MSASPEHRGWHCPRGLPHFDSPELPVAITFRLADSLPRNVALDRAAAARRRYAEALDRGLGACVLRDPAAAAPVEQELLRGHEAAYDLFAWCVMPNHVHVLIALRTGSLMARVVNDWKGASARAINLALGRGGALWQRDYFDRSMRNEDQFERAVAYMENNPVKAGLANCAEDWPFSSARRR